MHKSKLRSFLITLLILAVAILLGFGGFKIIQKKKATIAKIPSAKIYGLVVRVETAKPSPVSLTMPYLAEIQSDSDVELASKVTARIKYIVNSGSKVEPGDILVTLDAADLHAKKKGLELKIREVKNQIKAKGADLANLKQIHRHSKKLININAIPQEKYDSEASQIDSLQATIEGIQNSVSALRQNILELEDTLSYTVIKSPISGVVSKTYVAKGGIASGGKPLLSLSGGNEKRLLVRVSDNIKPSALIIDGDKPCTLTPLNSSYNGLDEYSCSTNTNLTAGNRVEVKLLLFSGNGILLPANAVLDLNGKHFVMQVKKAKTGQTREQAIPQVVNIKAEGSEGLLVDGIKEGDDYVVAKPDILLKLMTGVAVIRAKTIADSRVNNSAENSSIDNTRH
jgi:hypothetical protein